MLLRYLWHSYRSLQLLMEANRRGCFYILVGRGRSMQLQSAAATAAALREQSDQPVMCVTADITDLISYSSAASGMFRLASAATSN